MTSSILPILKPALAIARIAAWAPGPGVLGPVPPTALTLMCSAEMPFDFAPSATAEADFIAAYGEDSKRSAFTCLPPELIEMVSAPVRSVMCTIVLL